MKMLTLPIRTLNLKTFVLLVGMCLGATLGHAQEAQFRAVGGPGLERGKVVVPHGTGAFLVCNSKLPEVDQLRAYLVHYDTNLDVDWTTLLPCNASLQEVVDAWSDIPGEVTVLARELDLQLGYQTVLHRIDSTGTWLGSETPLTPQNFSPVKHVIWLGEPWIVGAAGDQPMAVHRNTGDIKAWGGMPGTSDEVTDAIVAGSLLIAAGSRTENDTTRTAIWGLYPLGQIAFEHVDIDPAAGAWSEADAMAFNGSAIRVLHSYHPPDPDDSWLLHSVVSLNPTSGQINGILYGPTGGQRPGRDLAWTSGGWLKLTQTDGFPQLDRSMLLTHYSPNGTYQSQGAWGTIFEDDPSHVTESEDGTIWVAGSTRGAIDGTWNACVLRLDSLGPLGTWSGELPGFGVYNDPLFDNVVGVSDLEILDGWSCAPNPANTETRILGPNPEFDASLANLAWSLIDARGQIIETGTSLDVPLQRASQGWHVLNIRFDSHDVNLRLLVERHP